MKNAFNRPVAAALEGRGFPVGASKEGAVAVLGCGFLRKGHTEGAVTSLRTRVNSHSWWFPFFLAREGKQRLSVEDLGSCISLVELL